MHLIRDLPLEKQLHINELLNLRLNLNIKVNRGLPSTHDPC